jgi:hypothetical protein
MLTVFAIYIILGNLPRIIPTPHFSTYFSISEMLLYCFAFFSFWGYRKKIKSLWLLPCFIVLSTGYGICLHGLHSLCLLYSAKLIGMLLAGFCIGQRLYERFGADLEQMARFFLRVFTAQLFLGFLIFFFFPSAAELFAFLEEGGLVFKGDPHRFRFVSSFLDPNYYGAIACIPLLLLRYTKQKSTIIKFLFFSSLLLTFSRSGILTYVLLLIVLHGKEWIHRLPVRTKPVLLLLGGLGCCLLFSDALVHFLSRLIYLFHDDSAYCRWVSFQAGWDYFGRSPLFGMGYHFLSRTLVDGTRLSTLDSSILQSLVNFGLIPSLCLAVVFLIWAVNRFALYGGTGYEKIFRDFFYYVMIVILFSSLFNNILYYTFWLIPIVAIFVFIYECAHSSCPRLAH